MSYCRVLSNSSTKQDLVAQVNWRDGCSAASEHKYIYLELLKGVVVIGKQSCYNIARVVEDETMQYYGVDVLNK